MTYNHSFEHDGLRVAHTPDPDDAYAWWAVATHRLAPASLPPIQVEALPIQQINADCLNRRSYDIAAVSSAVWPAISDHYSILSAGTSVGRGYGPGLVAREKLKPADISNRIVAVPGNLTTGALLLRLFYPGVRTIEMPWSEIAKAVLKGEVDAGVLIHEELLNWRHKHLHRVACLGQTWLEATGLPIPVGLNVIRRNLKPVMIPEIALLIQKSMQEADLHCAEATSWAMQYSIQSEPGIGDQFIHMFANDDTIFLAADCRAALHELYRRAWSAGLIPCNPPLEVVEVPVPGMREAAL